MNSSDNINEPGSDQSIRRPDDDFGAHASTETGPAPATGDAAATDDQPVSTTVDIDAIRDKIQTFLDDGAALDDFQPMDEWDLCTQGRLSEQDILQGYAQATGLPVIEDEGLENINSFSGITFDYLNNWLCLPVSWDDVSVALAVATPYNLGEIAYHWRHLLGRKVEFYLSQRTHIERLLSELYEHKPGKGDIDGLAVDGDASEEALRDLALEAPIVRLVNDMFARAVEMTASDIHVEPSEKQLAIRFRIDGLLQTVMTPPIASYSAIASRLKLIGGLNIAERRLPQDGRTDLQIGRSQIDVRLSTVPSMHGESIVLRILRKNIELFTLENIGMGSELMGRFAQLIKLPHGMVLVVGPTGSGKTTTLYCVMNLLDSEEKKIITIEDPVEYQIAGVTQIQVRPTIGLTFAGGLRHIVRQDPDIILVGEIRDKETADIAINAALTGHLVLSTLHTNDATGAISRLLDMGVEKFLISSALVGVLSQRLIRKVCAVCKGTGLPASGFEYNATRTHVENTVTGEQTQTIRPCRNCAGSGFRDRVGIFEFLAVDDDIRRGIAHEVDNATLNATARKNGMRTLREDGESKAASGVTTAAEVARACQLDF